MKNITVIIASAFIQRKGKLLIAKRADDDSFFPGYWEIAGGKVDFGELVNDAAVREIKEEVGLDITAKDILCARNYMHESNPHKEFLELFFLGILHDENQDVTLSHEHSDFAWVTFDELGKYNISDYTLDVLREIRQHPLIKE